jgi:uncharacterized protein
MKRILFVLILCLLLVPTVAGRQGYMKLLAVKETPGGYEGSVADLYLEIKRGSGRVFIDTFPLTKLDTQMSTRFAKEIACRFLDVDCDDFDFIYTIRAESSIIGGPSAGAAISVLTVSLLGGLEIDERVTITGTINSGGLVGPVGGLKEKIEVGGKVNLKRVIIPQGLKMLKEDNKTVDLVKYGAERGVKIVEVSSLNDAVYQLTGKRLREISGRLEIDKEYQDTMKFLSEVLCNRTRELQEDVMGYSGKAITLSEDFLDREKSAINLTRRSKEAFKKRMYYSAASYCFGANVKYKSLLYELENLSKSKISKEVSRIRKIIKKFERDIDKKGLKTITDLQTYMVVKDRLTEGNDNLNLVIEHLNDSKKRIQYLAYAYERISSAESWSKFFGNDGREFNLDKDVLEDSCLMKLSEAEERIQYVRLLFPSILEDTRKEIDRAYEDYENKNYALCLYKASKAKAESNAVLNVIGVEETKLGEIVNQKLEILERWIIEETKKGIFPIVGYSYYEYAKSLKEEDKYSALIYMEYALELSNLDMYFEKGKKIRFFDVNHAYFWIFFLGLSIGLLFSLRYRKVKKKVKVPSRKKVKKRKR